MDSACAVNVSSTLCAEYMPIGELYCCGMNTFTRPLPAPAGCHCCCWRLICSSAADRGGGNPATPAPGSAAANQHAKTSSVRAPVVCFTIYIHTSWQYDRIISATTRRKKYDAEVSRCLLSVDSSQSCFLPLWVITLSPPTKEH